MNLNRIYIAGHRGMAGSAIMRRLMAQGHTNLVTRSHAELDLLNQHDVNSFFAAEKPDQVYLAAAKVGGIHANNLYPGEFIYNNLMMQLNVIQAAHKNDVQKLLFLGSSCIYPKYAPQPLNEHALLLGKLEATNEPYAIAKIAGIKLCESYNRQYGRDYRSVMPTNLYGPGDNYHPENSHVVPALIRRFHEAKITNKSSVVIWGTGSPRREFLHVDDMANASVHLMTLKKEKYDAVIEPMCSHINLGSGSDITIKELADIISKIIGYTGQIEFDVTKPDGTPRKLMNSNRLASLGWLPEIDLINGLEKTYSDYKEYI